MDHNVGAAADPHNNFHRYGAATKPILALKAIEWTARRDQLLVLQGPYNSTERLSREDAHQNLSPYRRLQ